MMTWCREQRSWWAWLALAMLLVGGARGVALSPGQSLGLSQATPLNISGLTQTQPSGPESPSSDANQVRSVVGSGVPSNTVNVPGPSTFNSGGVATSNQGNPAIATHTGFGSQAGFPFSGTGQGSFSGFNFNNNFNPSGYPSNNFDPFGVVCPTQLDLTFLTLSNQPAGYPIENITAELNSRPDFAQFLLQEVVLPDAVGPPVPTDPRFDEAPPACPQQLDRLWSYVSAERQSRCWIMQNFQEIILYATCLTQFCQNCGDKFASSFDTKRNLCAKTYEIISVWSFCEGLPENSRIVRDRIVIPKYCSCKKVQCMTNTHWGKK